MDNPLRDTILKALRAVPGVEEDLWPNYRFAFVANGSLAIVNDEGEIELQIDTPAPLYKAVAVLTPPSVPKPVTYEYVAGIKGAEVFGSLDIIQFVNTDGCNVVFHFGVGRARINWVALDGSTLTTPQTEDEVLATLRMCRVEVGK